MGDQGNQQQKVKEKKNNQSHHAAVDDVLWLLMKSNQELSTVRRHLDEEFRRNYSDNVNPMKLVDRIKKIQDDIVALKESCRDLLTEKQNLIDEARSSLVLQKSTLQRLLASSGLPPMSESECKSYTNLEQVIDEWTVHVRNKTGEAKDSVEDINEMLFSAIVPNS